MQLTQKYEPKTVADFRGLGRPKTILENFVEEPYTSAWLLVGPSGLGKTTMAFAVQRGIGGEVYHIPSRKCDLAAVDELAHKCAYRPWNGGRFNTIIVDEADQATKAAQIAFLSLLDRGIPEDSVWIFTANDTAKLEDRFMSRCRVIEFTADEINFQEMLEYVWSQEAMNRPPPNYERIIKRAAGNVRTALMELEMELVATKPKPRKETRWFNEAGEAVGWDVIQERLATGDFAGIRTQEVLVYA